MNRLQPPNLMLWFGVLGGGAAWGIEFVAGVFLSWAQCEQSGGRTQLALRSWQTGLAAAGALVGLAALAVCLWIYLGTHRIGDVAGEERRGEGYPPPLGRVHFLAVVGLTVNFIVIVIMVITAIGAPNMAFCQQSS